MFDYVKIEGFRSFELVEPSLKSLTVLIGPNGSGKSNFLDLLSLLQEAANGQLADAVAIRGGINDIALRMGPGDIFVEFHFPPKGVFEEEKTEVSFKLKLKKIPGASIPKVWFEQVSKAPDQYHAVPLLLMRRDNEGCMFRSIKTGMKEEPEEGKALDSESELAIYQVKDQGIYPTPYKLLKLLQGWTFYKDFPVGPSAPVRQPTLLRSTMRLAPNGENLAAVLHSIQQEQTAVWKEIEEILETVYPQFHSVAFPSGGGDGKLILRWRERPFERDIGFSANLLSDGTLKLLCLIAILKSPEPPPLVCIDEPEVGLHPDWIKLVAELLQSAAEKTQVVVATHSPQLISKLDPDQVIVVEKKEGKSQFTHLSNAELSSWLKEFTLGELWVAGHIGGRP